MGPEKSVPHQFPGAAAAAVSPQIIIRDRLMSWGYLIQKEKWSTNSVIHHDREVDHFKIIPMKIKMNLLPSKASCFLP